MHVLLTGGGGYLGSQLCVALLASGHKVRVLDRLCFGEESLSACMGNPAFELVKGDIRRFQEIDQLWDGVDSVVHLASLSNDPSCELNVDMAQDVNVASTAELAKLAIQHGVERFILGSTCAVYGHGVFEILDEESPPNPVFTFGQTKLLAEQHLLSLASDTFTPVVLRCATLYGVSPRMRFDLALNQMVATAVQKRSIQVRGGGGQWRPLVHVKDAARGMLLALEAEIEQVSAQIFNVGSNAQNIQINALAKQVADHFERVEIELANDDADIRTFHVDFSKIQERLGFNCQHSIDDGVVEVAEWLRTNTVEAFEEHYINAKRMKHLLATPVDEGGEPVASRFIPLAKPCIGEEEERAVIEAMRSGWLTSGPQIKAFEQAFCKTVGTPHSLAVSSCTAALHLCLAGAGVKPGDEVITPPITWASTANTLANMGANIRFVDVAPDTLNVSPEAIEAAITERTKAIMPVHMAGLPCDLDAIYEIARRHNIAVIEDAAHALGASYKGTAIGAYGDMTCFSFYAIKNITTMEGGMIALKDADAAEHLRRLASNGMAVTAWDRYGRSAIAAPPQVVEPGFKYAIGNVGAAMGVAQLKKFKSFKAARRRIAHMYNMVLREVEEITLPADNQRVDHAWHLYVIQLKPDKLRLNRDEIAYNLRRENVGTGIHFYSLHLHPYYRETLGLKPEDIPHANAVSQRILSLPLHPEMSDKNVHEVVSALKKVLTHARK